MGNDLISRAALLKYTTRMMEYDESGCGVHVLVVKADDIEKTPTVDAEPVRHGRWEHGMRCTQCGQIDLSKPNYCPHCGAKMGSEVE